ncbi:MAG: hypothetical protein AAB682_03440 [Patescibacteria group bacterium]
MLTFFEILKIISLAIAGGTALWGMQLMWRNNRNASKLANTVMVMHGVSVIFALIAWYGFQIFFPIDAIAYEGITLIPSVAEKTSALLFTYPAWIFFTVFSLTSLLAHTANPKWFERRLSRYFFFSLAFIIFLISFPAWSNTDLERRLFFILHNLTTIFGLGTLACAGMLYTISEFDKKLSREVVSLLPKMKHVLWLSIGVNFAITMMIVGQGFSLSSVFYFSQTLMAIAIANTVFLSGPVLSYLQGSKKDPRFNKMVHLSGAIALSSFSALIIVEYLPLQNLSYLSLVGLFSIWFALFALVESFLTSKIRLHLGK